MPEETTKKELEEKSLEKLTIKELRDIAFEIPLSMAVHVMSKSEIVAFIKEARGLKDKTPVNNKMAIKIERTKSELKANILELKGLRLQALADQDGKLAADYRQRIKKLNKALWNVVRGRGCEK